MVGHARGSLKGRWTLAGRPPAGRCNTSRRPTLEEILAVMHAAGDDNDAVRLRGLIIVLWRAALGIGEAPALNESDLDLHRGAILVRRGKVGKRREVGINRWAWERLSTSLPLEPPCLWAPYPACCGVQPPAACVRRPVRVAAARSGRASRCALPVCAASAATRARGLSPMESTKACRLGRVSGPTSRRVHSGCPASSQLQTSTLRESGG
jgi:integrase